MEKITTSKTTTKKLINILGLFIISTTLIISTTGCHRQDIKNAIKKVQESSISDHFEWKTTNSGINYTSVTINKESPKELTIIKLDPQKFALSVYQNEDKEKAKTIDQIHKENNSILTFNGTYFDEEFKAMGLLIPSKDQKVTQSKLLNGVFTIDNNNKAQIFSISDFSKENTEKNTEETDLQDKYKFAIQSGPILINKDQQIPLEKDSGKLSSRTIIGIDQNGQIVLIFIKQTILNTDNAVSLYQIAHLIKEDPLLKQLNLTTVLNLDGGGSSGFMLEDQYYPEMDRLQNIIITKAQGN